MFNWADIRVFLELARQQHLTTAAARLRLDTSTVSRRVADLERVMKGRLFERSQGGFTLSELGQKLLPLAERMEAVGEEISLTVASPTPDELSIVRLATMEGLATAVIAPSFGLLREQHPHIALELLVVQQPTNLGRREADISLSMMKLDSPRLISERIGSFDIGLYASGEYLAKAGYPDSLDDLKKHEFIDYLEAFIPISEVRWLRELVSEPRLAFCSNGLTAQQQAAINGAGMVALPDYLAAPDTHLVRIFPDVATKRDLWLTVHADTEYFSNIRIVSTFIRKLMGTVLAD